MNTYIFNLTEIQKTYNNVSRSGKMLVSLRNEKERFFIFLYKKNYYEFEVELGECTKCIKSSVPFKYLNALINTDSNEVKQ